MEKVTKEWLEREGFLPLNAIIDNNKIYYEAVDGFVVQMTDEENSKVITIGGKNMDVSHVQAALELFKTL